MNQQARRALAASDSDDPPESRSAEARPANGHGAVGSHSNGSGNGNSHRNGQKSLLRKSVCWLRSQLGLRNGETTLKEAVEEIIEEHEEDANPLHPEEKSLLRNVLSIGEVTVYDLMIPRAEIVAVEAAITLEDLKKVLQDKQMTRIPVYKNTLDDVLGFIHIKDLVPILAGDASYDLQRILREVLVVSPSMRAVNLLLKMRQSAVHMAIVVDEYGGTDGLLTMEDLVEAIVGEIEDEHDVEDEEQEYHWLNDHTLDVAAKIEIEKLETLLGMKLRQEDEDKEDFHTLGGLVFSRLGRVPIRGELMPIDPTLLLEIASADPRRIHRVRITLSTPSKPAAPDAA